MGTQAVREYQTDLRLVEPRGVPVETDELGRGAPAALHGALDRFYQRFLEVFVFSSLWIAAGLASLTVFTAHVLGVGLSYTTVMPTLVVLFSGMLIYNLDHAIDTKVEGIPDDFAAHYFSNKKIMVPLLLGTTAATVAAMWGASSSAIQAFSAYVGIGLLYGIPLVPWNREEGRVWLRLKDIPGIKAWLVAFAMTVGGLALPVAWWFGEGEAFDAPSGAIPILAAFLFVFCASNTHVFDVRDMENDRKVGVVSLPIQAGLPRTKMALVLMNLTMLAVMAWVGMDAFHALAPQLVEATAFAPGGQSLMAQHPEILGCSAITILYILAIREDTPRDVYSILIDGCFFLPALLGLGHEALRALSGA